MPFAFLLIETADPATARIVLTVSPEGRVDLLDEGGCISKVAFFSCLTVKCQVVANSEGVRPQIAARRTDLCGKPSPLSELRHNLADL